MHPRAQDLIDELLSPSSERPPSVQNMEERPRQSQAQVLVGDLSNSLEAENCIEEAAARYEQLATDETGFKFLFVKRQQLLEAIDKFQSFAQSVEIANNFQTILRKDALARAHNSILGVIRKESLKLETALAQELHWLSEKLRTQAKEHQNHPLRPKDLHKTLPGNEPENKNAKEEIFEEEEL